MDLAENGESSIKTYPNPGNPRITVIYTLASQGHVMVDIIDIRGRKIAEIDSGEKCIGRHDAVWNGCDNRRKKVASGVYFVRISTEKETRTKKIILLR